MPRTVSLTLPWPPSLNRIWRALKGRVILSTVARDYCASAAAALPSGRVEPLTGRLMVHVSFCPPRNYGRRAWDVANREKLLFDVLTKQRVWLDDSQVDGIFMVRGAPSDRGHADVLIHEIGD